MSAFSGPQHNGAMRKHRDQLRRDAELRAAATLSERTAHYRRQVARMRDALVESATAARAFSRAINRVAESQLMIAAGAGPRQDFIVGADR